MQQNIVTGIFLSNHRGWDLLLSYSEKGLDESGIPHKTKCLFSCAVCDIVLVGSRLKTKLKKSTVTSLYQQAGSRSSHNYAPVDLNPDITEIYDPTPI